MLTIELNMYHAVALGAFLFWMGGIITDKVRLLNRYCIPAPLVGGLCFSILNCILYSTGIIGGISFVLYGMISAIGVRNVVENRVDFTNSRNLIVAAVILVCALGFNSVGGVSFAVAGVTINLSGLAVAAIAGILLNAILPGNDYEFDAADGSEAATSSNLQV